MLSSRGIFFLSNCAFSFCYTGGSSIGTHAQDYLPHHGPFPSFPSCFPRFPAGHHSPSQPLWLHQPFAVPTAHGPTSSSYQDVPLPGNVGLQGRDSVPSRQVMMFPPHLSASEGALHGLSKPVIIISISSETVVMNNVTK